jgi:hypothetical protein
MQTGFIAWKEVAQFTESLEVIAPRVRVHARPVGLTSFDARGLFIYVIWRSMFGLHFDRTRDASTAMYVGQTNRTVWTRIAQHIRDESRIGRALIRERDSWSFWHADIIQVDRNLDFAERHYIEKLNPIYNEQHNTIFVPDIADI